MYCMKKITLFLLIALCPIMLIAQEKHSPQDLKVLKRIISLNPHLDRSDPLQIGTQIWNNGRLTYLNLNMSVLMMVEIIL